MQNKYESNIIDEFMRKTTIVNKLKLILFCGILGAVSGAVLWIFLKLIHLGTEFLWGTMPHIFGFGIFYTIGACTAGGIIIGLFRKFFGDYPQPMTEVIGTVKKTGTYPYNNFIVLLVAALLPLIFGYSIGPEAGMVGAVVALACWAKDNLSFANKNADLYSKAGLAVSLSALFFSPLFGFFYAVENEDDAFDRENSTPDCERKKLDGNSKLLVYGISIFASLGIMSLLNHFFGKDSEGFPSFQNAQPDKWDFLMVAVYIICGIVLGIFFEKSEEWFSRLSRLFPSVLREILAGLVFGCIVAFIPEVAFSGETQMGVIIADYAQYAPIAMVGMALLKVLMTNMCIQMGLKGGHFFPLIFAAVCLGYGISLMAFPGDPTHATFAAAITVSATLSVSMQKPLAVTCLLLLCFPVRMAIWIFAAAILASQFTKIRK